MIAEATIIGKKDIVPSARKIKWQMIGIDTMKSILYCLMSSTFLNSRLPWDRILPCLSRFSLSPSFSDLGQYTVGWCCRVSWRKTRKNLTSKNVRKGQRYFEICTGSTIIIVCWWVCHLSKRRGPHFRTFFAGWSLSLQYICSPRIVLHRWSATPC